MMFGFDTAIVRERASADRKFQTLNEYAEKVEALVRVQIIQLLDLWRASLFF